MGSWFDSTDVTLDADREYYILALPLHGNNEWPTNGDLSIRSVMIYYTTN